MCCNNAAWKREVVPDHKSIAVYIADIYTAVALLASNRWSATYLQSAAATDGSKTAKLLKVPFDVGKWVFTGCIIFSFLLLLWEARKARAIIKSRDISYAFTNVMSQNWYSLRSYDHFCFFCQIDNSKKKKDEFAFFVFFTFKGWKRLLLADAPRQVINAITLYSFGASENWTTDLSVYFDGPFFKSAIIVTMLFTVVMWAGSALLLLIAAMMYVPLLCYIQGNLKEYCCHKVDKRIAELMKRKNRKRLAKEAEIARKEAKGDFSHLRDKKTGKLTAAPLPQPTLPKIGLHEPDLYSNYGLDASASDVGSMRYPPAPHQHHPHGHQGSLSRRPAFGYHAHSDGDMTTTTSTSSLNQFGGEYPPLSSFGTRGYNESVTSLDGFANRGAPMGFVERDAAGAGGPYGRVGFGRPHQAAPTSQPMDRVPSYKTEPDSSSSEELFDDDKYFGRAIVVDEKGRTNDGSDDDEALDDISAYVMPRQATTKKGRGERKVAATPPIPPPSSAALIPQARHYQDHQQYEQERLHERPPYANAATLDRSTSSSSSNYGAGTRAISNRDIVPAYQPPSRDQLYARAIRQQLNPNALSSDSYDSRRTTANDDADDGGTEEGEGGYATSNLGVSGSLYGGSSYRGAGGGGGTVTRGTRIPSTRRNQHGFAQQQHPHGAFQSPDQGYMNQLPRETVPTAEQHPNWEQGNGRRQPQPQHSRGLSVGHGEPFEYDEWVSHGDVHVVEHDRHLPHQQQQRGGPTNEFMSRGGAPGNGFGSTKWT
ncbi:Potassium transporter [Microbotryomycetes sp. JL221]|nr:Potassium transporter [Microbotryomycetes sp. JL221]